VITDVIDSMFFFLFFPVSLCFFHHTVSPYHINPLCLLSYVILSFRSLSPTTMFKTIPYLDVPQGTLYLFFQDLYLVFQPLSFLCLQLIYKISCTQLQSRIIFPLRFVLEFPCPNVLDLTSRFSLPHFYH